MKRSSTKSILAFLLVIAALLQFVGMTVVASESPFYIEGAQIRTTGKQGIRFVAYLEKDLYDLTYGQNANFGILLARKDRLAEGVEITMDNATAVPAKNLLENTDSYCRFSAVVTEQPAEFYGVELLARAYVVVDGTVHYSEQISRSIKQVAEMIVEQNRDPDDVAVAQEVLARYGEVGADFLINADDLLNNNRLVAYSEYPEQIARDYMYSVSVEQGSKNEKLVVYNQTEAYFYQDRFDGGDVNRRFCEFAFSGKPVTVNIRVNRDFDTYAVVPTSKGFASTYADGVISVTLTKPEQFVIILDDDVNTALSVFADAPETDVPVKGADGVIYVEGWNQITNNADATLENGILTINGSHTKLYIAPGAVLTARVVTTSDAYAVKIFGRGALLDPASLIYHEAEHGFDNTTSTSTKFVSICGYTSEIKDVKLLDSRGYNLFIERGNCKVQNVKILSTMMTTDGITTNAEGGSGIVKDCFVYCGDNALVTTVEVVKRQDPGYSFENITVGTTCSAIYPQHGVRSTFTDIYVFRADESLISMKETSDSVKYVTINNLDALDCVRTPTLFYAKNQGTGEKLLTLNKVLMRYTTGDSNVSATPGTTTDAKTMIKFGDDAGSNFTINVTDMYVGGNLITNQNQILISGSSSLTLTFANTANTPSVLSGNRNAANYTYMNKVMLGYLELFLEEKPVKVGDAWYLPYGEIASYLAVAPQNPVTMKIDGVEMISLSNLLASRAVTAASYNDGVIQITPAINTTTNLLMENYQLSSNYNLMYYRSRTPYVVADYENGTWVYSTASNDYNADAGISRMILDVYKTYGAGTYSLSFEYKSNVKLSVELGKDHDFVSVGTANTSSLRYTSKTFTFTLADDPAELQQLALCFKIPIKEAWIGDDEPGTLSIRNISLVKTN